MLDIISKENSIKDVSKEKTNYFLKNPKINTDDELSANNLSNRFEDNSINEMISLDMNFQFDFNNNLFSHSPFLFSPSPSIKEFSNDFPFSINPIKNISDKKEFLTKKKSNQKIRKLKNFTRDSILKYANKKILKTFNYDIGNGINKKELLKIDPKYFNNNKADFNKQLLEKTLGEIFSQNISTKITNYPKDFNKELINKLLNEEDLKKRKIFENLFSKTFLDCIDHIIGKKKFNELTGLEKCFENKINLKENREEFKDLLNNFEDTISSKKPRKSRN